MSWERYRQVMEQYAIKTDDMATEDAYFMATHMPFEQLEVYEGGQIDSKASYKTETQIFDELIYNPNNQHRVIIVRGNNGTGKSHLIRYMKAKLENSPSTVYNPKNEHIIFLRRLNNSVRGVFSQLLDQGVIQEREVAEKMIRFVRSSDARDEESFKMDILYSYIVAVSSDKSNETYREIDCKNIGQYLSDSRVQDHLKREDGPISRCYRVITTPSDQVLEESRIFAVDDFLSKEARKVNKIVINDGNPDAKDFAQTIWSSEEEVAKLVNYLNRFTSSVVQRCADISSETTKSVFEQLRKDLKKQGKNLTLFIEDFTGFTGIDSELITVLSTEHGGAYSYLCRVTAIIGITDGYYDQFKDNFKDRVTHQISVTEKSFGSSNFLEQMSALYLNAIFCPREEILSWYELGADILSLPKSGFIPPCKWDSVTIEGKELSLFPFNKKSIYKLYDLLETKTPRMFLRKVIKMQLKEYFDGKEYGKDWSFPYNPGSVQMSNVPHSSAIDRDKSLSLGDRERLKALFEIWGNGTATGFIDTDGTQYIGGINRKFLDDIALNHFQAIGGFNSKAGENFENSTVFPKQDEEDRETLKVNTISSERRESREERNYRLWKEDITNWFSTKSTLQYDETYRSWLRSFLTGSSNQCGAINWQDIGVPAFIANERLTVLSSFYIEDQGNKGTEDAAIVFVKRDVESRDMLLSLLNLNYYKNWNFELAPYYQHRLITWLEKNKRAICQKLMSANSYEERLPLAIWSLELQYIRAIVYGYKLNRINDLSMMRGLFEKFEAPKDQHFSTTAWKDLVIFLKSREAEFNSSYELLVKGNNTTMGAISVSREGRTGVYRVDELLQALRELSANGWQATHFVKNLKERNLLTISNNLLRELAPKLEVVYNAELHNFREKRAELEDLIGPLSRENLLEVILAINELFTEFAKGGIPYKSALKARFFEDHPIEIVENILKVLEMLSVVDESDTMDVLRAFSERNYSNTANGEKNKTAMEVLENFLGDLKGIEQIAQEEGDKARKGVRGYTQEEETKEIAQAAITKLEAIYKTIEDWEVLPNAY